MKHLVSLSIAVFTLFMCSCQKQIGWTVDPLTKEVIDTAAIVTPPGILNKVSAATGAETIETLYTYDSLGRVMSMFTSGYDSGIAINVYKKISRDTSGRIARIAEKQAGADTVYTVVEYDDPDTKEIWYMLKTFRLQGAILKDSSVFTYDGNKRISIQNIYRETAGNYKPYSRHEFAFRNGNMISLKTYTDTSGNGTLAVKMSCSFEYDNRLAPLNIGNEGVVLGNFDVLSQNNPLKVTAEMPATSSLNYGLTNSFIYGSSRTPLSGTSTKAPGGSITKYTYSYQ